jgi:hypothetical protein
MASRPPSPRSALSTMIVMIAAAGCIAPPLQPALGPTGVGQRHVGIFRAARRRGRRWRERNKGADEKDVSTSCRMAFGRCDRDTQIGCKSRSSVPKLKLALRVGLLAGIAVSLCYRIGAALIAPDLWTEPWTLVKAGPAIILMVAALAILEDR